MNKILRIPAAFMYSLSILSLIFYFFFDLDIVLKPHIRVILLVLVCLCTYFASLLFSKTLEKNNSKLLMKITFFVFFLLYVLLLATLVLFDSYFGREGISNIPEWSGNAFKRYFSTSLNIIPFRTIAYFISGVFRNTVSVKAFITNIFGNLAAFSPFAFFLPLLFGKTKKFMGFFFSVLLASLLAELMQVILLTGACDIDDIILNVGGACVLYFLLSPKPIKNIITSITRF